MKIIRSPRTKDFLLISNSLARDARMSYRARGLLIAMLSRPDGWQMDSRTLAAEAPEGRDAVRTALREIEDAGYMVRRTSRNPDGTFTHEVEVFDEPVPDDPAPENPTPDNPAPNPQAAKKKNSPKDRYEETEVLRTSAATCGDGGQGELDLDLVEAEVEDPGYAPSVRARVAALPDATVEVVVETLNQQTNRVAKTYTNHVPMSRFVAVAGIVRQALKIYDESLVVDALDRLGAEGRPLTVDTLRIEIEGLPPRKTARQQEREGLFASWARRASEGGAAW